VQQNHHWTGSLGVDPVAGRARTARSASNSSLWKSDLVAVAAGAVGVLLYHTPLSARSALGVLAILILGAAAWTATATATALASMIPTVDAAGAIMIAIYFPVVIISGVVGSIGEPGLAAHARSLSARRAGDPGRHRRAALCRADKPVTIAIALASSRLQPRPGARSRQTAIQEYPRTER
jgi:hypothetical protein